MEPVPFRKSPCVKRQPPTQPCHGRSFFGACDAWTFECILRSFPASDLASADTAL